jgi:hypothetical protein
MSIDSTSETAIFSRLVLPSRSDLTDESARALIALGFSNEDRERMSVLAEKARQGALTADEQREADNYERVGHYLSILQSKARLALDNSERCDS